MPRGGATKATAGASDADLRVADSLLAGADDVQRAMMEEEVILTNYYDDPIGKGSKKETHVWKNIQAGMLHRAFSVFLFSPEGKLVLQQRASTKVTFPLIWANTCCSHPLSVPGETEMDNAAGVKRAARRKLEQELGIPPEDVPLDSFTWITRVHYVGACEASLSKSGVPQWGEHEIDWILMCAPPVMPRMAANPNEVENTKAFTQAELRAWMASRKTRGEEVSPWFACMEASGLLYRWWDAVLARRLDTVIQRDVIHREHDLAALAKGLQPGALPMPTAFVACLEATKAAGVTGPLRAVQCEPVHPNFSAASGASTARSAGPAAAASASESSGAARVAYVPGASAATPKQGAYGKVRVIKESTFSQLCRLDEVATAIAFKLGLLKGLSVGPLPASLGPDAAWCEDMLCKTSRSFALVIQQLPVALRQSIGIFYLVLRGLDTVEDDMEAFVGRQGVKLAQLRSFHTVLSDPTWRMDGVGEGDEATLLQNFGYVSRTWATLAPLDRAIIEDICSRMGEGMASFAGKDLRGGTANTKEYNLYCHYVAGLVGEGLTRLFVAGGYEASGPTGPAADLRLADDMGLFLQKTNIIRDYLEDLVDGRAFYPADIWSKYGPSLASLRDMAAPTAPAEQQERAVACLNHMVADALSLAPSVLRYMATLRNPDVFRFCCIPQLMALATLDKLANNADVFAGVVKIRRGQALLLMTQAGEGGMKGVYLIFLRHTRSILAAIPRHHAQAYEAAEKAVRTVERMCIEGLGPGAADLASSPLASPYLVWAVVGLVVVLGRYMYDRARSADWGEDASGSMRMMPRITDSSDVAVLSVLVAAVAYLMSFAGVPVVLGMAGPPSPPSSPAGGSKGRKALDGGDAAPAKAVSSSSPSAKRRAGSTKA